MICIDFNGYVPDSVAFMALEFFSLIFYIQGFILWIAEVALQIAFEDFAVSGHVQVSVQSIQSSLKFLGLLRYQIHFSVCIAQVNAYVSFRDSGGDTC